MTLAPEQPLFPDDARIREQASNLRSLLVLSSLMTESGDDQQIVHLMATAVCSFAPCEVVGVHLEGSGWSRAKDLSPVTRRQLETQFQALPAGGGRVGIPDATWAFAFPLRGLGGAMGYLVVSAERELTKDQAFLLSGLGQQAGVALANARLLHQLRVTSAERTEANTALALTVNELRRTVQIHERLTEAAASGLGQQGLAQTLHELTKLPVAIEDRWGNLRAWAGGEAPDPYPKESPPAREQLIRDLQHKGRSFRDRGRLVSLAAPRPDAMGVISLIDPQKRSGTTEVVALEHATTVLAAELARLHSVAEAELRLRRDLVEELLAGTDRVSALARAAALGHDLERPHRVVVVHGHSRSRDEDQFLHAVRTAARNVGLSSLIVGRSGAVILLTAGDADWEGLRQAILREIEGGLCRMAIGGECDDPSELPRSHQQAQLALRLQSDTEADITCFDNLGVYCILSGATDVSAIERFITQNLGGLLAYDAKKGADLVHTLHEYLEAGGNYEATAQALVIHRSTLKYRLQRIRAITNQDLGCPNARFNLQLATRAWQTVRALKGVQAGD